MQSVLKLFRNLPYTFTKTSNLNFLKRVLALPPGSLPPIKIAASLLEYHSLASGKPARVLQIGAFDGITNDPIHHALVRGNLIGVLLEPLAPSFRALSETYQTNGTVNCLNKALGSENGKLKLYFPKSEAEGSQVASFSRDHVLNHVTTMNYPSIEIAETEVDVIDISTLLSLAGHDNFDLIQIDTEGHDDVITNLILDSTLNPMFIGFETAHLRTESLDKLFHRFKDLGFEWIQSIHDALIITKRGQRLMEGKA
ncbi:MAG: FkbM family methyltransferase [Puniceicoccaceae bacterium]